MARSLKALSLLALLTSASAILLASAASAATNRPVYVSDSSAGQISIFSTGTGGDLLAGPANIPSSQAEGEVFSPNGKFLYVADSGTGIRAYAVGAGGALTELAGSPFGTNAGAFGVTVTADGKYLYANSSGGGNGLYGFAIGANGSLSATPGSPYAAGTAPYGLAASPDSKSLYSIDDGADQIRPYTIAANGSLTLKAGGPLATGDDPYYVIITPDGKHVYAANYTGGSISGYAAAADGGLTQLAGSPFALVNGPYAGMAVNPDGTLLFVTSYDDGVVVPLAIAASGSLTVAAAGVNAGNETNGLAITPDGRTVYASAGLSRQAFAFSVQPGGGLAAVGVPRALSPTGNSDFQSVAVAPNQAPIARMTATPHGRFETFDASASTDPDGGVASYLWSFGDGTTETTTSPTVTHEYAGTAVFATSVRVTDDEGCSTVLIYTGQATLCNGTAGAKANVEAAVRVEPPDRKLVGAEVSGKKTQKQKGSLKIVIRAGALENVDLVASGFAGFKGVKDRIALTKARGSSRAGRTKTLRLMAKEKDQGKAVVGFRGRAELKVKLTDNSGNHVTKKLAVKLK